MQTCRQADGEDTLESPIQRIGEPGYALVSISHYMRGCRAPR